MKQETDDQIALVKWISASLIIPEVRAGHGDASYILRNMIAKYSLGASEYQVSEAALRMMQLQEVDPASVHYRAKFYGKKSLYIYEHSVPVRVIRDQLLSIIVSEEAVRGVLQGAGGVAILLRTEDDALNALKLKNSMPKGWSWGGNLHARYSFSGILLSDKKIRLVGRIRR